MKRDMDVVRHILLETERADPWTVSSANLATPQWSKEVLGYNAELMAEAGLLRGDVEKFSGVLYPTVQIERLTWDGHDFLDAVRDDSVWNQTKSALLNTAGTAALEVVKALAVSIARTSLGLPPA